MSSSSVQRHSIAAALAMGCCLAFPAMLHAQKPAASRSQKPAQRPASPQKRQTQASPELKQRYEALQAAKSAGDPVAVIEASKRISAYAYSQVANLRMLVGAYPQALELYRQSLALEGTPGTQLFLAIAALRSGQADEAIAAAAKVVQLEPQNSRARLIYAKALRLKNENVVESAAPVDETAQVEASMLANAALSPADKRHAKAMEKDLRDVLSNAFNDRGTAEARQGQYATALEHFHEAERWNAETPGLMRNIGIAAYKLGNADETIRALRLATQADPQDKLAQSRLAITLFARDLHTEAVKHFDALGEDVYRDPATIYAYAYSLVRVNQQRKATAVLNRLSQLPLPADFLINVGDLYGVLEDYEHAVASYRNALQQEPSIPRARYKMGAALIRLSRSAEAIPELQAELNLSPLDVDVQYNLAYALLETSQKNQALPLLRRLLASQPEHPHAQYQLGKALLEDGKYDEAIEHLEIAEKLDPSTAHVHYQLQIAYRRSGRVADADREAKIYKEIKNKKRDAVTLPMPEHKQQP